MIIHNEVQGSPEWIALRLNYLTASEAMAMMGVSPYMTRTQLLDMKKTGIAAEVTPFQQRLFDEGHAAEARARPIVEAQLNEELYPLVGSLEVDGLKLLASFDGLTMLGDVNFEHKLNNQELVAAVGAGEIPEAYQWQLEQQLLVAGAERVRFVVSDGTEENMAAAWYESRPEIRERLISGWHQFNRDLAKHEVSAPQEKAVAAHIDSLPALLIEVAGAVTSSNLAPFKAQAKALIASVKTDLQTDQDFADAEELVKVFDKAEKKLEEAKDRALSSTASIEELFRTMDDLKSEMRTTRLKLNKLVTGKKEELRRSIYQDAINKLSSVEREINQGLAPFSINSVPGDIPAAMKNKRTIESLRDAAMTEASRIEQEMRKQELHVVKSKAILADIDRMHKHLFPDFAALAHKAHDDLQATIKARIAEHAEAVRQAEERAVAKAKADAEAEAAALAAVAKAEEQAKLAVEANQKAKLEAAEREKSKADQEKLAAEMPAKPIEQAQSVPVEAEPVKNQSRKFEQEVTFQQPEKLSEYDAGYLDGLRAGLAATNKTYEQLQAEYLRSAA